MEKYSVPFMHYKIADFLNAESLKQLKLSYEKLEFHEKTSDLFKFFQTNELANYDNLALQQFKNRLNEQFKEIGENIEKSYLTMFASYYREGDYLLVHDDLVADRKMAFSFYLETHETGELIFYDCTACKESKRIKVEENTLVIFEVSDISYHEVAICKGHSRKAVTGWFNVPGVGEARKPILNEFHLFVPRGDSLALCELPIKVTDFMQLENMEYCFDCTSRIEEGPFFSRRVERLNLDIVVAFSIKDFELISTEILNFRQGDYLLLNDPVNKLGPGILDIFIFESDSVNRTKRNYTKVEANMKKRICQCAVKVVEKDGTTLEIPLIEGQAFVIKRNERAICVERVAEEFKMAHFIYKKKKGSSSLVKKIKKGAISKGAILST